MDTPPPPDHIIHATTISVEGRAALIVGPSGAGKSSLALQLIAMGAHLVADDRTVLERQNDAILARPPDTIAGLIEARGVGLLSIEFDSAVPVALVVDLSRREAERLPEKRSYEVLGIKFPCLLHAPSPHFAASILLYLTQTIPPAA